MLLGVTTCYYCYYALLSVINSYWVLLGAITVFMW